LQKRSSDHTKPLGTLPTVAPHLTSWMTMGARRRRSSFAVHCTVVASVVSHGRAKQTQTQINPSYQKYSTLPKFGNIVCVGHPSPQKGRSYVVTNAGWELRWTRAALKAGLCVQGEMNLVSMARTASTDGAQCLQSLLPKQGHVLRSLGRSRKPAYGETVWSWSSLLRSSLCEGVSASTGAVPCISRR
jgi:hypothetical protein